MSDVTVTIDSQQVTVPSGTLIIEAARRAGIHIPSLCHHPSLKPFGACRMCLVEIAGKSSELFASCATPVRSGMEVFTSTPRVMEAREFQLKMFLIDHPLDCPICEASGNCKLQDYTYDYGISENSFRRPKMTHANVHLSPLVDLKRDRCVLCGLCVRACDEVIGARALAFAKRGVETVIDSAFGRNMRETTCVECGLCIEVCPVGCLSSRMYFGGHPWEVKRTSSICSYCGVGCSLYLETLNDRVVSVASELESGVNNQVLCAKGYFGYEYIDHPNRLSTPMIRENGQLRPASWDEALECIATNLKSYQGDAFGAIASGMCTNEDNYVLQRFARQVMRSNNVDFAGGYCHRATIDGLATALGIPAGTATMDDMTQADCVLVAGASILDAHPVLGYKLIQSVRRGATKLIVIDPRRTSLAEEATIWLRPAPGTDVALLNGLAHEIIALDLTDPDFIGQNTVGFDSWKAALDGYGIDRVAEITGITAERLRSAARLYASGGASTTEHGSSIIAYGSGVAGHSSGTDAVMALADLALLTGNIGRPGTGIVPMMGQANHQGAIDMGVLPNWLPGHLAVDDPEARAKFAASWGVNELPAKPGLTLSRMLDSVGQGGIQAMYVVGANPAVSHPDVNRTRDLLSSLKFLVVQDIFMTETAGLAHVMLPAAVSAEKDGTFTNFERRVQRVRKASNPPLLAKADWNIIADVSARMGQPFGYKRVKQVMDEIAGVVTIYGGISHNRLGAGGIQWPCPDKNSSGTPRLFADGFAGAKARFGEAAYAPPFGTADKEKQFRLAVRRSLYHFNTGTMTHRTRGLELMGVEASVEISPFDAGELGLEGDDLVVVSSRNGKITASAEISSHVPIGTVYMTPHFPDAPVNALFEPEYGDGTGNLELKLWKVRIARLPGTVQAAPRTA